MSSKPLFTNNAATALAVAITPTSTVLQVVAGTGQYFPQPTGTDYFMLTLVQINNPEVSEIVQCTSRTGDFLTVVRGQENTQPQIFNISDNVELRITAGSLNLFSSESHAEEDLAAFEAALASSSGSSLVGYTQGGTGATPITVQQKLREWVCVKDFGAAENGVTDDSVAVAAAVAAAGNRPLLFTGTCNIVSGVAITCPIVDTLQQIFTTASNVTINNGQPVRPEWWGTGVGTIRTAIAALPATGGTVQLSNAVYNMVNSWTRYDGNQKPNVRLVGSGMPIMNSDMTQYVTGSGTIIQGMVLNFADGFEAYDFGVDCGTWVTTNLNGGTGMEGFVPGTHKLDHDAHDLQYYIKDVHFENISCLQTPGLAFHGILCEHIIGLSHGYCETFLGLHGYVVKSINVQGGDVRVYGQVGDAFIIKCDQYTLAQDIYINSIRMGDINLPLTTASGIIQGLTSGPNGYVVAHVTINSIQAQKCVGILQANGDNYIVDVNINSVYGDQITSDAIIVSGLCQRWNINNFVINQVVGNGIVTQSGCKQINISNGSVTNAGQGYDLDGLEVLVSNCNADTTTNYGFKLHNTIALNPNTITGVANGLGLISAPFTLLSSANLINGYTSTGAGTQPFNVYQAGNMFIFQGMVTSSSSNPTFAVLPYSPGYVLTFITYALHAGTGARTFAQIDILADGTMQVANLSDLGGSGAKIALNFVWQAFGH